MARVRRMGEVYSAGDVTVNIAGLHDVNPSAIEYNSKYAHEYSKGLKRKARGWRMGAREMDAKITLPLDVISVIEKVAPKGELAFIRPFPITVVYTNEENDIITDIIIAKFIGQGRSVTVDGELEKEYELFPTDIKFNVV